MCVTIIITYCASMLEYWMSVLSLNQSLCMCTVTESITVHVYCHWINHCTCILSLNQSLCMCTVTDSITVHVYCQSITVHCHWLYHTVYRHYSAAYYCHQYYFPTIQVLGWHYTVHVLAPPLLLAALPSATGSTLFYHRLYTIYPRPYGTSNV